MLPRLHFEPTKDECRIYIEGKDAVAVGYIRPARDGYWFGKMKLHGYVPSATGSDWQTVAGEFEAWVAAGMPSDSDLLKQTAEKRSAENAATAYGIFRRG
ncbi:MAG TPA: hypothetical protein VGR70_20405 [Stellaceae bacterium]|nr:hypothetical protein [Stellaceae bacterium]